VSAWSSSAGDAAGGGSASTSTGASIPASRSAITFLDERDREPAGPGLERGPGDRHGAVAVAVALDDRAHLGAGDLGQARDVVGDRVEVDLGDGGAPLPVISAPRSR
jgi:hypothetical protein